MKSKDIRFASEFIFDVRCDDTPVSFKEAETYEYQVSATSVMIGNEDGFAIASILKAENEVISNLSEFHGRSLLRLDKISPSGVLTFSLLCFFQHVVFNEPYQVVLDETVFQELRRRRINEKDTVKFFMDELVFGEKYWFAYGGDSTNSEQRLRGKKISVVVRPSVQGYLHIVEIQNNRNNNDTGSLVSLMSGVIEFKDSTKELHRVSDEFMDKYRAATRDNAELIKLWNIYDQLSQEAIKQDAVEMGVLEYKSYKRRQGKLVFSIVGGYVTSDFLRGDMQYAVIPQEVFNKEDPMGYNPRAAVIIGSEFDKSCVHTTEFVISDDQLDAFKKLPDRGYVVPSITGSIIQSNRRNVARKRILYGENPMMGLNLLLQTGAIIGTNGKTRKAITEHLREYIFGSDRSKKFTDSQMKAIGVALNTPDIAVIQGPPGTGKTQVIRAIVERINEDENGKAKILISSTQHDAVDNAIKGVTYGGVPVNRVFNKERSSQEAPIFGWIDEMISSCGSWLNLQEKFSRTTELFDCIERLRRCDETIRADLLKHLCDLLQTYNYPSELVARCVELSVKALASSSTQTTSSKDSRLSELLLQQRLDAVSFCEDGQQQLKALEMYLKYDYENVDYAPPSYWRQLKRSSTASPELDELLAQFRSDIEQLREMCTVTATDNDSDGLSLQITSLLCDIEAVMTDREPEKTPEERLFDLIWIFKHELSNIQNVKSLISSYSQVNAATCQQAANKFLSPAMHGFEETYDYVIIDEAARSNPLDLLIPMSMGKKVILVGDHKQLPHMVEHDIVDAVISKTNDDTAAQVLEESLFMRLFTKISEEDENARKSGKAPLEFSRTGTLREQFRMHSAICNLIKVFYTEEHIETACADAEKEHGLGLYNNCPLAWIDVLPSKEHPMENGGISKSRPCEVEVVRRELAKILVANSKYEVGIITFYSKQAELLRRMVDEEYPGDSYRIAVGTVDAFQGKEFDVVILSSVRSNREKEMKDRVGFLNNNNRLCVAFSRAKRLLITIGDSSTVANDGKEVVVAPLDELLKRSKQEGVGYYEAV